MSGHEPNNYVKIWAILVVLLIASVVGPLFEIPLLTLITAFGIALIKAFLVIKHFMHLPVETIWLKRMLVGTILFMLALFFGLAPDVMNHEGQQWSNDAAKAAVERGYVEVTAEPTPTAEPEPKAAAAAADPATAVDKAWVACAACHGADGAADTPTAAALNPKPRDFTDAAWHAKVDDARIEKVIREGGPAVGLSPLMTGSPQLSDEVIEGLVARIRSYGPPAK